MELSAEFPVETRREGHKVPRGGRTGTGNMAWEEEGGRHGNRDTTTMKREG